MLNIKEIALKVAKEMRESAYPNPYIPKPPAIDAAMLSQGEQK